MVNDAISVQERRRRKRAVEYALRLGDDERAVIAQRAAACGLSMAQYIRNAALAENERTASMSVHDAHAIIRALTRIGVDLRQIARGTNPVAHLGDVDLETVIIELRDALTSIAGQRLP